MVPDVDRRKLLAFGASGVLWTAVMLVLSFGDPMIVVVTAVYFLIFTLAVSAIKPAMAAVLAAWVIAMLLSGVVVADADNLAGAVIVGAVSLGTVAVGGWVVIGFLMLLLLDPSRRKPVA